MKSPLSIQQLYFGIFSHFLTWYRPDVQCFTATEFPVLQRPPGAHLSATPGLGGDNPVVVLSLLCPRSPLSWGRQLSWLKEALPPVPGQSCAHCTEAHPSLSLGPGHTNLVEKVSEMCTSLLPSARETTLCSDRLSYTKQALSLSTKHGRWCQAVPAQKLELRTLQW